MYNPPNYPEFFVHDPNYFSHANIRLVYPRAAPLGRMESYKNSHYFLENSLHHAYDDVPLVSLRKSDQSRTDFTRSMGIAFFSRSLVGIYFNPQNTP
jgi:hypothetical protein